MEKFSLYDFLGLLLPGVLFLFFFNVLNNLVGGSRFPLIAVNLDTNVVILLCFALIAGAILYASNFYLVTKTKWYNRLFGMYEHVTDLYLRMKDLHPVMNATFNKKSMDWYEKSIFFNKADFDTLLDSDQEDIKKLQDKFYDRIYYELEYCEKDEHSKAFQSFYYFFRQTSLACLLLFLVEILMYLFSILLWITLHTPVLFNLNIVLFTIFLLLLLIISVSLARWYRKRMVMKTYWAFFTHLQLTSN